MHPPGLRAAVRPAEQAGDAREDTRGAVRLPVRRLRQGLRVSLRAQPSLEGGTPFPVSMVLLFGGLKCACNFDALWKAVEGESGRGRGGWRSGGGEGGGESGGGGKGGERVSVRFCDVM